METSDVKLVKSTRKILKNMKFPVNENELQEKFSMFLNEKEFNERETEFVIRVLEGMSEDNMKIIKETIGPLVLNFISFHLRLVDRCTESSARDFINEQKVKLACFIELEFSNYVANPGERADLGMGEFIEFYIMKFYQQVYELSHLYVEALRNRVSNRDEEFKEKVISCCRGNLNRIGTIHASELLAIAAEHQNEVTALAGADHWVVQIKQQQYREFTSSAIPTCISECTSHFNQQIEYQVNRFYNEIIRERAVPFDTRLCKGPARSAFSELISRTITNLEDGSFYNDLSKYLQFSADYSIIADLSPSESLIETWVLSTSVADKIFYLLSLILIISRAIRLLNTSNIPRESHYDPRIRQWAKELARSLFQEAQAAQLGVPSHLYGERLFYKVEDQLATCLKASGFEWVQLQDSLTFKDTTPEGPKCRWASLKSVVPSLFPQRRAMSLELIKNCNSMHVVFCVSGWLSEDDNMQAE